MIKKSDAARKSRSKQHYNLGAVFDKHIKCEFEDHDVDATMKTMIREPYVHHVPIMTGGVGYDAVYNFYKNHFVGKMPKDTKVERISRTVGKDQVVDELILKFTLTYKLRLCCQEYLQQAGMWTPQLLPVGLGFQKRNSKKLYLLDYLYGSFHCEWMICAMVCECAGHVWIKR